MTKAILWLSLIQFPTSPGTGLGESWLEVLLYAHAHQWQSGRDIIFTWGPLGIPSKSFFHLGAMSAKLLLAWQIVGKLAMSAALVALTGKISIRRQIGFVAACALCHLSFPDIIFLVFITLAVVAALMDGERSAAESFIWVIALAFLAEFKFSYGLLATVGVGAASAVAAEAAETGLDAPEWRRNTFWPFSEFWVAAGQNPDHVMPYLRRSLELVSGYGGAMGLEGTAIVFWLGVGVAAACGVLVLQWWRAHPARPFAAGSSGFLVLAFFTAWKEGFVRADSHPLCFFFFVLILAASLPGLGWPQNRRHWFEWVPLACLWGAWATSPELVAGLPRSAWNRLCANARVLPHFVRLPAAWEQERRAAVADADLPEVRRAVGNATIDCYNFSQGSILLNRLNYAPRPVFQSYSAYTPGLDGCNLRYYQSGRAPDFLLWSSETVDGRFPSIDDASLIPALAHAFTPILAEGRYWLLKKTGPVAAAQFRKIPSLDRSVRLGEEVLVPPERSSAVWFQATLRPSRLGWLRAAAYKSALIDLVTVDDLGQRTAWRVVPRIAEAGFLLEPLLASGSDLAAFLRGRGRVWLRSLSLECPPDQAKFWGELRIRFYTLPDLRLQADPRWEGLIDAGIADGLPVSVVSEHPTEIFALGKGSAMLLHAKGEIVFDLPLKAGGFSGTFGIRREAYEGGGRTEGVDFLIEGVWSDGRRSTLWHRNLDPLHETGDRGPQRF